MNDRTARVLRSNAEASNDTHRERRRDAWATPGRRLGDAWADAWAEADGSTRSDARPAAADHGDEAARPCAAAGLPAHNCRPHARRVLIGAGRRRHPRLATRRRFGRPRRIGVAFRAAPHRQPHDEVVLHPAPGRAFAPRPTRPSTSTASGAKPAIAWGASDEAIDCRDGPARGAVRVAPPDDARVVVGPGQQMRRKTGSAFHRPLQGDARSARAGGLAPASTSPGARDARFDAAEVAARHIACSARGLPPLTPRVGPIARRARGSDRERADPRAGQKSRARIRVGRVFGATCPASQRAPPYLGRVDDPIRY